MVIFYVFHGYFLFMIIFTFFMVIFFMSFMVNWCFLWPYLVLCSTQLDIPISSGIRIPSNFIIVHRRQLMLYGLWNRCHENGQVRLTSQINQLHPAFGQLFWNDPMLRWKNTIFSRGYTSLLMKHGSTDNCLKILFDVHWCSIDVQLISTCCLMFFHGSTPLNSSKKSVDFPSQNLGVKTNFPAPGLVPRYASCTSSCPSPCPGLRPEGWSMLQRTEDQTWDLFGSWEWMVSWENDQWMKHEVRW